MEVNCEGGQVGQEIEKQGEGKSGTPPEERMARMEVQSQKMNLWPSWAGAGGCVAGVARPDKERT